MKCKITLYTALKIIQTPSNYQVIPVPYPVFTWCTPQSEHTYDTLRAEEAYIPNRYIHHMKFYDKIVLEVKLKILPLNLNFCHKIHCVIYDFMTKFYFNLCISHHIKISRNFKYLNFQTHISKLTELRITARRRRNF